MKLRPQLFSFDPTTIREVRQKKTHIKLRDIVYKSIIDNETGVVKLELIKDLINVKALDRLCDELNTGYNDIFMRCTGDSVFSMTLAHTIAKQAHRQSSGDEAFVLEGINEYVSSFGVNVKQLGNNELRPGADGKMYNRIEFKDSCQNKRQCPKSIDGRITGKIDGYITQKICIGKGGGQDNVLVEMYDFAEWATKNGSKDSYYICLVDTDLEEEYNTLKDTYDSPKTGNIWVVNHKELQERIQSL